MNDTTQPRARDAEHESVRAPERARTLRVKSGLRAGAEKKYLEYKLNDILISSY